MQTRLKFTCDQCAARLAAKVSAAGRNVDCPRCAAPIKVPHTTALVPYRPPVMVPATVSESPRPLARRRRKRRNGSTPVELRLPGQLGGLKAKVDRKTSNVMATTFLGGMLVAIGAVLFSMFGSKAQNS